MGSGFSTAVKHKGRKDRERLFDEEDEKGNPKMDFIQLEEDNPDRYLPTNGVFLLDNEFYEKIKKGKDIKTLVFEETLNHKDKIDILCAFLLKIKYLNSSSESMGKLTEDISREILATLDIVYAYFAYIKQTNENELNPEDLKTVICNCIELYYFLYFLKIDVDSMFDEYKWWAPQNDFTFADKLCYSIIRICRNDKKFRVEVIISLKKLKHNKTVRKVVEERLSLMRGSNELSELRFSAIQRSIEIPKSSEDKIDPHKKRYSVNFSPDHRFLEPKRLSEVNKTINFLAPKKSVRNSNFIESSSKLSISSTEKANFIDLNNFEFSHNFLSIRSGIFEPIYSNAICVNDLRKRFLKSLEATDLTQSSDNCKQFLTSFNFQFINCISKLTYSKLDSLRVHEVKFFDSLEKRTKSRESLTIKLLDSLFDNLDFKKDSNSNANTRRIFDNSNSEFIFEITNKNEISQMKVKIFK